MGNRFNIIEGMSSVDPEALNNLSQMYKDGHLQVSKITVTDNITVANGVDAKYFKLNKVTPASEVQPGSLYKESDNVINIRGKDAAHLVKFNDGNINMGSTKLEKGNGGCLRVQTSHGWGEFGPQNGKWLHIQTDRPSISFNKKINVKGDVCRYSNKGCIDMRRLESHSRIGGFAVDGDGTTMMLEEGQYKLHHGHKYDSWTNDKWDHIFIYKGWKVELWEHYYDSADKGTKWTYENKTKMVERYKPGHNRISSYKLTWVGF